MTDAIRVIQYGLGPIGCATARLIDERDNLELIGAVHVDPAKIGSEIGELIGLGHRLGIETKATLAGVDARADVVVHTTNSFFDLFMGQLLEILEAGFDVVSTSEELTLPWIDNRDQAARLDAAAREARQDRARHRRQPRLPDGRAAAVHDLDRAASGPDRRETGDQRQQATRPVPGQDRLRDDGGGVSQGDGWWPHGPRRSDPVDRHDLRLPGQDAGAFRRHLATAAIAVNAIRRTRDAAPGLVTMRDLPIVTVS